MTLCFNCSYNNLDNDGYFCKNCNSPLSLSEKSPFAIFKLAENFELDQDIIKKKYTDLLTIMHPDQFPNKDAITELITTNNVMAINQAYQILTSARLRSEFLLKKQNIIVNQDNRESLTPKPDLLNEIFMLREEISENNNLDFKLKMQQEIIEQTLTLEKEIKADFINSNFENAAHNTIKLRYLEKILEELS